MSPTVSSAVSPAVSPSVTKCHQSYHQTCHLREVRPQGPTAFQPFSSPSGAFADQESDGSAASSYLMPPGARSCQGVTQPHDVTPGRRRVDIALAGQTHLTCFGRCWRGYHAGFGPVGAAGVGKAKTTQETAPGRTVAERRCRGVAVSR